jgi:hypothetical protein
MARLRFPSRPHAATYYLRSSSKTQRTETGEFFRCLSRRVHSNSLQKTGKCEFWAEFAGFEEKIKKFAAKFPAVGNLVMLPAGRANFPDCHPSFTKSSTLRNTKLTG